MSTKIVEKRAVSQPPKMMGQLIDLVNCLPQPYQFPVEHKRPWLNPDGTQKAEWAWDFSKAKKPLEARLLHPDVILAEVGERFNQIDLEYALRIDSEFAHEFEDNFLESAGYFGFYQSGKRLFSEWIAKQPTRIKRRMVKSLAKTYGGQVKKRGCMAGTYANFDSRNVVYSRLKRFHLSHKLIDYLCCEIFPPLPVAETWLGTHATFHRWYDLWDAAYRLWASCGLAETDERYTFHTDGRLSRFHWSGTLVDDEGVLRTAKSLFDRVIESADIEASRLRECEVTKGGEVCGRVFWAARKDQKTCSSECSNLFHVHRYRHKTREEKAEEKFKRLRAEQRRQSEFSHDVIY